VHSHGHQRTAAHKGVHAAPKAEILKTKTDSQSLKFSISKHVTL